MEDMEKNISHLFKYLKIPPLPNYTVCLRGELIMSKKNFEKYKHHYSNPRNLVAGIVNAKYPSVSPEDIDLIVYELIEPRYKPSEYLKILSDWKFNVVPYTILKKISIRILNNILEYRKKNSNYEIDGIVVLQDSVHPRNTTRNPKYSFAFKGQSVRAVVKVIEVLWKPTKDKYLIPRVRFQKTNISGVELEYATGFNAKFIKDNKIGPGARIIVARSGNVIPQIVGVIKPTYPSFPNVKYSWDRNLVNIIYVHSARTRTLFFRRGFRGFQYTLSLPRFSEDLPSNFS
jgi:NAD-dependent DNA ligase